MWEAIYNVLDNSIKYTKEGGRVSLNVTKDENNVVIEVSDTGIGIAKDEIYKIFDRFYRVDKARARASGGVGLGLRLCAEIVRVHGGTLTFESAEGAGTTVTVLLKGGDGADV